MRRLLLLLALGVPALFLLYYGLFPQYDRAYPFPLPHFYIVTFTSFAASVVSFLLAVALAPVARRRHVLVAVAFALMSAFFFFHGLTTPGAVLRADHPAVVAVGWSAWLTLFSGGVVFVVATLGSLRAVRFPAPAYTLAAGLVILLYLLVVLLAPGLLQGIEQSVAPWHRLLLFYLSLVLWLVAAVRFWRLWRQTGSRVDGSLALVAAWLALGTISMHRFPLWYLGWWLYHFILLTAFLFTMAVLFTEYEQLRQFRLMRYFLAGSLILTALLALVASYLFTSFIERTLQHELEGNAVQLIDTFTAEVGASIPADTAPPGVRNYYAARLATLPIDAAVIYDEEGRVTFPRYAAPLDTYADELAYYWQEAWEEGETVTAFYEPGGAPAGYEAPSNAYSVVVYRPLPMPAGGQFAGVLVAVVELPQLSRALLQTRSISLLVAAGTMGLLFLGLLVVVSRADAIINAHTEELAVAYSDLRQAEEMRDDLTNMVVHDLRTPLTALTASLALLERMLPDTLEPMPGRMLQRSRGAAERLDTMIDDILLVSKMESGELKLAREVIPLDTRLGEWLEAFTSQAESEEKHLALECPPGLQADVDPSLVSRIVENLVGNAFKYTQPAGHITVSAACDNGELDLLVQDDGAGVPDDYKEHIFRKFGQVPDSKRPPRKGIGLGLTFCRLAAEAHGGQIWVEDAPGGGTIFHVTLPASVPC